MNKKLLIITLFIFVAAIVRVLPHAPNFTPIGAMALFAGAYISNRLLSFLIPTIAMVVSDAMMGFSGWAYPEQTITVYATFLLITLLGSGMRNNKNVVRVGLFSISASVVFFITTNFMVWLGGFYHVPALYTLDVTGLIQCYVAAIPFFSPTLASDLMYCALLFGSFYLVSINAPKLVQENN